MTQDQFWHLISEINVSALESGDDDTAVFPLKEILEKLSEPDLEAYHEYLSQKLHDLDGEVFADNSGESRDSDDAFLYARCYVVAKGKDFFHTVIADPSLMPKSLDLWCESLLYPHKEAWAKLTRSDPSEWIFDASVSYESGSNERLWER